MVTRPDDHRFAVEPAPRSQRCRKEQAPLGIELDLEGAREDEPLEGPGAGVGERERRDLGRQLVPLVLREDREAGVDPARDEGALVETGAEARRDRDPPLVVDGVPVLAGEHLVRDSHPWPSLGWLIRGSIGSAAVLLRVLRGRIFFQVLNTMYLSPTWSVEEPDTLVRVTERYKVAGILLEAEGRAEKVQTQFERGLITDSERRQELIDLLRHLGASASVAEVEARGVGRELLGTLNRSINTVTSDADYKKQMSDLGINLVGGTLLPSQIFGEKMVATGKGSIINVASMSSIIPLSRVVAYSASKAAVLNLTLWLAREWATKGVRVNAISPGFFPAEQNRRMLLKDDGSYTERGAAIVSINPLRERALEARQVGAAEPRVEVPLQVGRDGRDVAAVLGHQHDEHGRDREEPHRAIGERRRHEHTGGDPALVDLVGKAHQQESAAQRSYCRR